MTMMELKDVGTRQIKMVSVKMETCHMGRILQQHCSSDVCIKCKTLLTEQYSKHICTLWSAKMWKYICDNKSIKSQPI